MAVGLPSPRCGRGHLAENGGRCHLSAGHAEDGVVDEDHCNPLGPVGGVQDLGGPDRRQVAVTLVGEDDRVGVRPLHPGRYGRRPSVRDLDHVHVQVVVCQHRAADRGDADRPALDAELVDNLGQYPMRDPVAAARAVVRRAVLQDGRPLEYCLLCVCLHFCTLHRISPKGRALMRERSGGSVAGFCPRVRPYRARRRPAGRAGARGPCPPRRASRLRPSGRR